MQARVYGSQVRPALEAEGITIVRWDELSDDERDRLGGMFTDRLFPVLTPLAVDPAHPFPYISGLSLNLAVVLVNPRTGKEHFARVKVPPVLPRLLRVEPGPDESPLADMYDTRFVPLEDVISAHLDHLFPGMEVREHFTFRVTRNEDLEVEEDDAENLLTALERELTRRRFGPPVRLEVEARHGRPRARPARARARRRRRPRSTACRHRSTCARSTSSPTSSAPTCTSSRSSPAPTPTWRRPRAPRPATSSRRSASRTSCSSTPTTRSRRRCRRSSSRPRPTRRVLAIKQTLYRTSGDSPIIDALIDAAEAGKQVLAVVEIKARFDEQNNISWARKLEHAGVHVVYGIVGLKTHAKLCLVVRQEAEGLRRYCHVGTGNYNPKTARLYEDLGLLTVDPQVGEDLTRLFNQLSGIAPRSRFKRLLVAPRSVRSGLIDLHRRRDRARAAPAGHRATSPGRSTRSSTSSSSTRSTAPRRPA